MNDKKMMRGMSILMVLLALVMVASGVQAQEAADNVNTENAYKMIGAGLAHWALPELELGLAKDQSAQRQLE